MDEEINEFEMVPEYIAREIEEIGTSNTYIASDGSHWFQCDVCGRWIIVAMAERRRALPCETGYDANGFEIRGGGWLTVCPECQQQSCPCGFLNEWWCPKGE